MRVVQINYLKLTCPDDKLPELLNILCQCDEVVLEYDDDYVQHVTETKPSSFGVADYPVRSAKTETSNADPE